MSLSQSPSSRSGTVAAMDSLGQGPRSLPPFPARAWDRHDRVSAGSTWPAVLPLRDAGLMLVLNEVELRLDSLLAGGPRVLVVDLSGVRRLSSTTIAALLWVRRRCSERGVDVLVCGASRRQVDMLRRIGLGGSRTLRPTASRADSSWYRLRMRGWLS
jgi:anti-anti-sigma regulatory factor